MTCSLLLCPAADLRDDELIFFFAVPSAPEPRRIDLQVYDLSRMAMVQLAFKLICWI